MELGNDDVDGADSDRRPSLGKGSKTSTWSPSQRRSSHERFRRGARQVLAGIKNGVGKARRHQRASSSFSAATMLTLLPFGKPLSSLDYRYAKHILLRSLQPGMMEDEPTPIGYRPSSPVESRRPRLKEDPCPFRTRLVDPAADPDADLMFESTDKLDGKDLRFDDGQCISVNRSTGKFRALPSMPTFRGHDHEHEHEHEHDHDHDQNNNDGSGGGVAKGIGPHLFSTTADTRSPEKNGDPEALAPCSSETGRIRPAPALAPALAPSVAPDGFFHTTVSRDPTTANRSSHFAHEKDGGDDDGEGEEAMERMNLPFWNLPGRARPKRPRDRDPDSVGDRIIPDDMSVISDVSLIPTYFPADIMKQQRPPNHHYYHHRALPVKHVLRAKARAAGKTMRQLQRSCRDAVGHVFVERAAHRHVECVPVGVAAV